MKPLVFEADCIDVMANTPEAWVDAIVTDPPYNLTSVSRNGSARVAGTGPYGRHTLGQDRGGFMGKTWDGTGIAFDPATWVEALRVLKPGGHLLAFGGTRTYHRLVCAIEDAGFEIRDTLCWLYGSGFPKSLDVSKAIDKAAGAEREVVGSYTRGLAMHPGNEGVDNWRENYTGEVAVTVPATPDAERWNGWGTALKPAHEPIVLARKPLTGTVAVNVLAHGTGALNIDGCRIGTDDTRAKASLTALGQGSGWNAHANREVMAGSACGRWPANVLLDEEAAAVLDDQTGTLTSGRHSANERRARPGGNGQTHGAMPGVVGASHADSGGASRFFYCAKAASRERNAGLEDFEKRQAGIGDERPAGSSWERRAPEKNPNYPRANHHPTVKPIALMRWLVRLVTPPGGIVLDPFMGSGTTGIACGLEGLRFAGIEREPEYMAIARARLAHWVEEVARA